MAQFSTFWAGFIAFVIFATIGIILTFILGGMVLDQIYDIGIGLPHGDEETYSQMQAELPWFMNLYYLVGIGSSILGAIIFGQAIVKRVRTGQYEYR